MDDEMVTNNFNSGLEDDFNVICNIVFVLLIEFDCVTEVIETEDEYFADETENHKPNGIVKSIEEDQIYFLTEVNHVDKRNFDKNLVNIPPCQPIEMTFVPVENGYYFMKLYITHGFVWDHEIMGHRDVE